MELILTVNVLRSYQQRVNKSVDNEIFFIHINFRCVWAVGSWLGRHIKKRVTNTHTRKY